MNGQQPPKMEEEQEYRVDAMLRRQDSTMAFVRNTGLLVVGLIVISALAVTAVFSRLGDIRESQEAGRIRTYQSRAVNCSALLLASAMRLPGDCTDPDVLPYVCRAARETGMVGWAERIETQTGAACTYPET